MKKLIVGLFMMASLPIAFMAGCGSKNTTPSVPAAVATATPAAYAAPQTTPMAMVALNSAADYVILSATGITNSGPSTTCGGYAVYPAGLASITGPPALVESCGGDIDVADTAAATAQGDLGAAYSDAMGRTGGATLPPGADIGGQTLYPGLYMETGNLNIASADLTLNGQGNPNAVFIFQVNGDLIVGPGRQIILANSASAANIFWAVTGYGALNTTVSFKGNIMAHTAVTLNTGATLTGRALAKTADVTLLTNTITVP
ncbi:MAG TPA: ice-binding family protein [bacterium]|nr:ice-binding family protein [bacterium]